MEMEEDNVICGNYIFRGVDYTVTIKVDGEVAVDVQVEDTINGDVWRGTFDAAYVEDLTHKTGNFKQFSIFVSMLESALNQTTDSVTLDLLTYSDLESLRERKTGVGHKSNVTNKTAGLNTKRYLILTYTVEFDRIHYPLPLPYAGKQSPRRLQDVVNELRAEIRVLRGRRDSEYLHAEIEKLQKNYDLLLEEKETVEAEFIEYKREVRGTTTGSAAKEIKIFKNMIKNLESDLMKEKTRHQRSASKRSQEYRQLLQEVEDLRSSERNLKVRVKSLTNELAMYKRRQSRSPGIFNSQRSSQNERRRSSSADRTRTSTFQRERSTSKERPVSRGRPPTRERLYNRSSSRDRPASRDRPSSRERHGSVESLSGSQRRNISPAGTRKPRFDPTAYIRDKEIRKQEANTKRQRVLQPSNRASAEKRPKASPLYQKGSRVNRSRTSSVGSTGSRGGYMSDGNASDASQQSRKSKRGLKTGRTNSSSAWNSPNVPLQKPPKHRHRSILTSSTPDEKWRKRELANKENYHQDVPRDDPFNRSAEITEIDERLNRLQAFMKANLAS